MGVTPRVGIISRRVLRGLASGIFNQLKTMFSPILEAGIDQQGFSKAELDTLNAQVVNQTGTNYKNAAQAVNEELAAQGDRIEVRFVETPLPEPDKELNRTVSVLIKVSVECTVFVSRDLAYLMPMFGKLYGKSPDEVDIAPLPEELETQLTWDGGISATADIVDGEFTNIIPKALVPEKQ